MSQPLRTSQGKNGKNENNAITQLKMVLLCALVHSFLRFEERIEIIRQNPKLLPNWYSSWLALLPLVALVNVGILQYILKLFHNKTQPIF